MKLKNICLIGIATLGLQHVFVESLAKAQTEPYEGLNVEELFSGLLVIGVVESAAVLDTLDMIKYAALHNVERQWTSFGHTIFLTIAPSVMDSDRIAQEYLIFFPDDLRSAFSEYRISDRECQIMHFNYRESKTFTWVVSDLEDATDLRAAACMIEGIGRHMVAGPFADEKFPKELSNQLTFIVQKLKERN